MAEEPISLDISLYVSRLIACSRWVTEVDKVVLQKYDGTYIGISSVYDYIYC